MKDKFKILFLSTLITLSINTSLIAQISFASKIVNDVYFTLPGSTKELLQSAGTKKHDVIIFNLNIEGQTFELNARFNEYKELEHIGLYMFKENENLFELREVLDFVERSFLISLLKKDQYCLENAILKDDVELLHNGAAISHQNKISLQTALSIIKNAELNIKTNSDAFLIGWKNNQNKTLTIKIDNNYSLVTGKTKDELEKILLRKIKDSKSTNIDKTIPTKSQLRIVTGNIYCLPGQIYSTTPELSSAKYFQLSETFTPVFDRNHYRESVRNLFLNIINSNIKLNLVEKMYGGTDEKLNVNINNFNANFADNYNIYFGWQNDDKENLKASVFFSHKIYNYNHLLIITTNYKTIFKKDAEIDGILMTYIPREKQISPN